MVALGIQRRRKADREEVLSFTEQDGHVILLGNNDGNDWLSETHAMSWERCLIELVLHDNHPPQILLNKKIFLTLENGSWEQKTATTKYGAINCLLEHSRKSPTSPLVSVVNLQTDDIELSDSHAFVNNITACGGKLCGWYQRGKSSGSVKRYQPISVLGRWVLSSRLRNETIAESELCSSSITPESISWNYISDVPKYHSAKHVWELSSAVSSGNSLKANDNGIQSSMERMYLPERKHTLSRKIGKIENKIVPIKRVKQQINPVILPVRKLRKAETTLLRTYCENGLEKRTVPDNRSNPLNILKELRVSLQVCNISCLPKTVLENYCYIWGEITGNITMKKTDAYVICNHADFRLLLGYRTLKICNIGWVIPIQSYLRQPSIDQTGYSKIIKLKNIPLAYLSSGIYVLPPFTNLKILSSGDINQNITLVCADKVEPISVLRCDRRRRNKKLCTSHLLEAAIGTLTLHSNYQDNQTSRQLKLADHISHKNIRHIQSLKRQLVLQRWRLLSNAVSVVIQFRVVMKTNLKNRAVTSITQSLQTVTRKHIISDFILVARTRRISFIQRFMRGGLVRKKLRHSYIIRVYFSKLQKYHSYQESSRRLISTGALIRIFDAFNGRKLLGSKYRLKQYYAMQRRSFCYTLLKMEAKLLQQHLSQSQLYFTDQCIVVNEYSCSILIQSAYRRFAVVKKLRQLVTSVVAIQRRFRIFISKMKYSSKLDNQNKDYELESLHSFDQERLFAVRTIQKTHRRSQRLIAFKMIVQQRVWCWYFTNALLLQTAARALQSKRVVRIRSIRLYGKLQRALTLQTTTRLHSYRIITKCWQRYQNRKRALSIAATLRTNIQMCWEQTVQQDNATLIQGVLRGFLIRRQNVLQTKNDLLKQTLIQQNQTESVITIQSCFRGYTTRRLIKEKRNILRNQKATAIQSLWKGFSCRIHVIPPLILKRDIHRAVELRIRNTSACRIQLFWRCAQDVCIKV